MQGDSETGGGGATGSTITYITGTAASVKIWAMQGGSVASELPLPSEEQYS